MALSLPALFVEESSPNVALRCVDILRRPQHYEPLVRSTKCALRETSLWPNIARTAAGVYERVKEQIPMRRAPRPQDESLGLPMWIEEVLQKGRFADADTASLKEYRFGLAEGGGITTHP